MNRQEFLKWLMASWEEKQGRASGKALSAFLLVWVFVFVVVMAVLHAERRQAPEFIVYALVGLIFGLYGVKAASTYMQNRKIREEKKEEQKKTDEEER